MYQPEFHQQFADQRRHDLEARAARYRLRRRAFANTSHKTHRGSSAC